MSSSRLLQDRFNLIWISAQLQTSAFYPHISKDWIFLVFIRKECLNLFNSSSLTRLERAKSRKRKIFWKCFVLACGFIGCPTQRNHRKYNVNQIKSTAYDVHVYMNLYVTNWSPILYFFYWIYLKLSVS